MSASAARNPGSVTPLQKRLQAAAHDRGSTAARLSALVANTALCQMLPSGAVKGGSMRKLRFGDLATRATPDLDTALRGDHAQFIEQLRINLAQGWGDFTGTVLLSAPQRP